MRVFYAVGSQPHASLVGSSVWHINLYLPLIDLGHEVVQFEFDLLPFYSHLDETRPGSTEFVRANRPRLEAELMRQVERAHAKAPIDVFFSYFYSAMVTPRTIERIRAMGIHTVNWYCNASYQFDLVRDIAPAYDTCLVPEHFRLEDYRRAGANPIYCQEAANPTFYHPYERTDEFEVTFVGSCYGNRPEDVRYLLGRGIDVRVFGPGWSDLAPPGVGARVRRAAGQIKRRLAGEPLRPPLLPARCCGGGMLSDEGMVRMYSRSRVSLGFSVVGGSHGDPEPIRQVRLRDFEAPMSGAFYLVEYMPEIEEFFVPGVEIACYTSKRDLADRLAHYLSHPEEMERIRAAGHERALRDHTWQQRFHDAFSEMGLG